MSDQVARELNDFGKDRLPGMLGLEILSCSADRVTGRIPSTDPLIAGTGFVWAPVVLALADALCAQGAGRARPVESKSFTTVELKANFLGTAAVGDVILGEATPAHLGRSTQVWDATVSSEKTGKTIALFRCTQLVLW